MYKRILAAIDGSVTSGRGLDEATALAGDGQTQLCLLHVVDEPSQKATAA
ncbi:MAG TPA: universal stress protein [Burkholderiales bacterium]|nr:universal stress protein [Burkholderiales bacterium]